MNNKILILTVGLLLAACGGGSSGGSGSGGNPDPDPGGSDDRAALSVLSNRPDMVSAGDVLVEVLVEDTEAAEELVLLRNNNDVSDVLTVDPQNPLRFVGRVDGLALGDNTLSTNIGNSLTVVNHPSGGPVFTGPHLQPWTCQDSALDEDCNQPVEYRWLYKSSGFGQSGLQPYDLENPADDVAMTTTDGAAADPARVHRAILAGLLSHIGILDTRSGDGDSVAPWAARGRSDFVCVGLDMS